MQLVPCLGDRFGLGLGFEDPEPVALGVQVVLPLLALFGIVRIVPREEVVVEPYLGVDGVLGGDPVDRALDLASVGSGAAAGLRGRRGGAAGPFSTLISGVRSEPAADVRHRPRGPSRLASEISANCSPALRTEHRFCRH